MGGPVRRAAVAGSWYPGDAASIRAAVDACLAPVPPRALPGRLVALISPHAGLTYSGPVAAYGYARLRGQPPATVILVGPSHRTAFEGVSAYVRGRFQTPLGDVLVDEDVTASLRRACPMVADLPGPHRDEHSLEMQLPFLQHVMAGLRIVPLLMGAQTRGEVDALAAGLAASHPGWPALLVASSDLSHYHPAAVANRLDALVVDDVERFDPERLMDRLEANHSHACGGGPMVAVMKAARALGATRATILRYADSGDAGDGDKSRVVGYLSAALTADEP